MLIRFFCCILLVMCGGSSYAQLCKGSLGDPIVTIDFGAGTARYGPPLPTGNTTYPYSSPTLDDGYYTILNTTANTNTGWFTTTDHTGNAGGYMMVVNASVNPQVFYTRQIDGLCPGTTYEFAAWVMNLLNYSGSKKPDLTFTISTIDGKVLGHYDTGSILESPTPTWLQYGLLFTTPADQTSIIIKITNNGAGGVGNDLALDDITFRPCGPLLISSINNKGSTLDLCIGQSSTVNLSAVYDGGYINPQYQWQVNTGTGWTDIPGATSLNTNVTFNHAAIGTYQYRLEAGETGSFASVTCRVVSDVSTVTVHALPVPAASNSGVACIGSNVTLTASGGTSYSWTGPNGFHSALQSPVLTNVSAADAGEYQVAVSSYGCESIATTTVSLLPAVNASAGNNVSICTGSSTMLTASGGTKYAWSPAAGLSSTTIANPIASPAKTTTYTVAVSNESCTQTASVTITVLPNTTADAGEDQTIIAGQGARLNGTVTGGDVHYYWTPSTYLDDPNSLTPIATPPSDITYTLNAISAYCTSATSAVNIKVNAKLIIPNTFSPNGDGVNDVWNIAGLESYSGLHIEVLNRYGTKVYESNGYPVPWDGRYNSQNLPVGTYYYFIRFRNQPTLSGWILIVR